MLSTEPLRPGGRIGPYHLVRELGSGGMGVVYEVRRDGNAETPLALKIVSPWLACALGRERFEREVRTLAAIGQENTVAIYDYGETEDGTLYYAMEYLHGLDLAQLVGAHGPQPAARCVHILAQVAAALEAAHRAGVVHRDIKPPNILLCEEDGGRPDVVKLVDFGLVLPLEEGQEASDDDPAGPVLGTPRYVAPEMLDGPSVGPAADLYGLGLVAYYLLTGHHAFDGETQNETLRRQLHEPPPPWPPAVPRALAGVLDRVLRKDPGARPPTAAAVRAALLSCEVGGSWTAEDARAWWSATAAVATA
ncbi:MAG: serine/threonine-protein kinase [Sandaracinaceae bacterium]